MSNLLQKDALFEFLAPKWLKKSMSKSTGLHDIFRKIAILFSLCRVPLLSNSFQRELAFQFIYPLLLLIDSIKRTVVEKLIKTATFNEHANSS